MKQLLFPHRGEMVRVRWERWPGQEPVEFELLRTGNRDPILVDEYQSSNESAFVRVYETEAAWWRCYEDGECFRVHPIYPWQEDSF